MWKVEYNNDTGPRDDSFSEWWDVTDGEKTFTSKSERDAIWLCVILNVREERD